VLQCFAVYVALQCVLQCMLPAVCVAVCVTVCVAVCVTVCVAVCVTVCVAVCVTVCVAVCCIMRCVAVCYSALHSGRRVSAYVRVYVCSGKCICICHCTHTFFDGYCTTVQGLLDWFEVDLGFTELSFIHIDLCVLCVFVLYSRVSLSSCPFPDILHCLPRALRVLLESALNLVSPMSPCGAHDTHACCARSNDHLLYLL